MFHFLYYSIHRLTYLFQLFSIVVVLILLSEACSRKNDCCNGRHLPHPFSTCRSCRGSSSRLSDFGPAAAHTAVEKE